MRPYQNEADAVEISDLKVENRLDRITIYGRIDLTRDKAGLETLARSSSFSTMLSAPCKMTRHCPSMSPRRRPR